MNGPYIGEVRVFAGTYTPDGWLPCDGQVLSAEEYPDLFAVIGSRYDSNGSRDFCLPDLRARAVMGSGQGSGLSQRTPGEKVGTPTVTLESRHLPRHKHKVYGCAPEGDDRDRQPTQSVEESGEHWLVLDSTHRQNVGGSAPPGTTPPVAQVSLGTIVAADDALEDGVHPHENRQPYLGLRFCIAWRGRAPA